MSDDNAKLADCLSEPARQAHDRALKSGILYVSGDISDESIYTIYHPLLELRNNSRIKQVEILINSAGGDARLGLTIAKFIANSKKKIITRVVGVAQSAAAIIFLGGHTRIVSPGSELMFHNSWIADFKSSSAQHSQSLYRMHKAIDDEMVDWIMTRSGIPDRKYVANQINQEWYMTAAEALELGVANSE